MCIGPDQSNSTPLDCGVPHGSIVGPSEFISYTEDIEELIRTHSLTCHLYADDTQLLSSMRLEEFDSRKPAFENCVSSVQQWCARRRLQLNADKSELIWFVSWSTLEKLSAKDTTVKVGSTIIKPAESVRNFGVALDSQLNMQVHISKVASSCFYHLRRLRPLRRVVAQNVRQRLVSALVFSRVDCCNSSLAGLPAGALTPLQRVLNAATRFVADLRPRDHVTSVQRSLHWLPIRQCIQYKLCVLMYGAVHGYAPDYIRNLATLTSAKSGRSHLRSADSLTFDIPRMRTRMGDRALSVAGPRAWNALPADIRCAPSWTLLRSISKHICFLLPTIYNNCFTQFYSLFYIFYNILVCSADHGLVEALLY